MPKDVRGGVKNRGRRQRSGARKDNGRLVVITNKTGKRHVSEEKSYGSLMSQAAEVCEHSQAILKQTHEAKA